MYVGFNFLNQSFHSKISHQFVTRAKLFTGSNVPNRTIDKDCPAANDVNLFTVVSYEFSQ
jgi:hypothetical protein